MNLGIKDKPGNIWNLDETGLQDNFTTSCMVGDVETPCFEVTAGEKGVLAAFNPIGTFASPVNIFKAKRLRQEWLHGSLSDNFVRVSDN